MNMTESILITQYGVCEGFRRFGDKGTAVVLKEVKQLHGMKVIEPIRLTPEQKRLALMYLIFLKIKRDGTVKGRGCADSRPQQNTMSKIEASSRTPATESVIITCMRDTLERRHVVITDIPEAFLQANQEADVFFKN